MIQKIEALFSERVMKVPFMDATDKHAIRVVHNQIGDIILQVMCA